MRSPIGKLRWDYVRWRYRCCHAAAVVAALNVGVPASAMSAAALREKALAPLRRAAMELSLQL